VPNDRVDAAAKGISDYLPHYQRSPTTQLALPNCDYPVDFPEIPVLKHPPFRIGNPCESSRVRSDRYGAYYYDRVRPHPYPRANAARAARLVRRCVPYSLTAATETPQHIGLALKPYDGGCPALV
jgi:hypothetical protein